MKGSYLLCPQKHALKSSPSVNTSSPNRDFFHNTFFQSRRNCLHPCCCLVWLASTYISAWSLCCGSFHLHQFKQENNIGMQKNGCQSYLLIRLGSLYIRQVTCKCCTCSLTFLFNRFPTTNDSRDVIGAYNIAFEPHNQRQYQTQCLIHILIRPCFWWWMELICYFSSGTAFNSFCEIKVLLDETFQMCVYVWRSQPFFIQNIQRKEEAMIIFTSLLTQRLFLCSMIFLERLRKNPAKPIEIKYISHFLQPSSLLFVYLMKALLQKLILFT